MSDMFAVMCVCSFVVERSVLARLLKVRWSIDLEWFMERSGVELVELYSCRVSLGCLSAVGTGVVHLHVTTRGHCFLRELWRPHLTSLLPDSRFFKPYLFLPTTSHPKQEKKKTKHGVLIRPSVCDISDSILLHAYHTRQHDVKRTPAHSILARYEPP